MIKAVIFDLDGTLLQSIPDIGGSMNRVLQRFGLNAHPIEAYYTMVGNGARILTERAVGERRELIDAVYKAYRQEYAAHTCDNSHPYDGIPELLKSLRDNGILTAVFSNKDHEDVVSVLKHYFPEHVFDAVRGHMEGVALKPAPDGALMIAQELDLTPQGFLYVGDTGTDMDCGKNAGMETVGVTWGFRTRAELEMHQACHIIDRPEELLELIH